MPIHRSSRLATRCYRLLLWSYPIPFRQRYTASLIADFRQAYEAARGAPQRGAMLRLWIATLADIFHTAIGERMAQMQTTRWWFWGLILLLGLGLGAFDYHAPEVQGTLILLLPLTFVVGLIAPRPVWRWVLLIGLSIPIAHIIGHVLNIRPPYKDYVLASSIALMPVCLGVYSGLLLRIGLRSFRLQHQES